MKTTSVTAQVARLEAQVQADVNHWHDLIENGCNDPFWPDGVNLNLVRNHIIYGLRQIAELSASERQLSMFEISTISANDVMRDERIPPKVDDNYMVKDRYENGRRVKSEVVHCEEEESNNESDMGIHGSEVKLR